MRTRRVLVIEEHPLIREGLKALLDQTPNIEVVGTSNGDSDLSLLIGELRPTVVLMDPNISNGIGPTTIRLIKLHHPAVHIVALTTRRSEADVLAAVSSGIDSYVLKQDSRQTLLEAIESADRGGLYLSSSLQEAPGDLSPPQSDRELDVRPLDLLTECVFVATSLGDRGAMPHRRCSATGNNSTTPFTEV